MLVARWITIGLALSAGAIALSANDASAQAPVIKGGPQIAPPIVTKPGQGPTLHGQNLRTPPVVKFTTMTCSPGQVQCFVAGGKVPYSIAKESQDATRLKTCVLPSDPEYDCGSCNYCFLVHTVSPFCGPTGCDYRECAKDWADEDGNRKNGCEIYRPKPLTMPPGNFKCTRNEQCEAYMGINTGLTTKPHGGCAPTNRNADAHGCVFIHQECPPFRVPTDSTSSGCGEDYSIKDHDGDTLRPLEVGGYDCDDSSPYRSTGFQEVCDALNIDEDCDPHTTGAGDADKDGLLDASCCNVVGSLKYCGTDCDDKVSGFGPNSQRCAPDGSGNAQVCAVDRTGGSQATSWQTRPCGGSLHCVTQPSGVGTCQ